MGNHFNRPGGNNGNVAAAFGNFIGPSVDTDSYGLLHSFNVIGGFSEVPEISDRDAIPVYDNGIGTHTGFTAGVDGYSTGRRRIGMLVYVMETKKIYQLLPKGYFGNQGDGTFADFNNLTEWDRARLLHPTATNIFNDVFIPPPQGGPAYELVPITDTADSCWVELQFGGDNIYTSNLANTVAMVADVGGMAAGTTVADLSNIKTYDQLFDTILFPTSYPTASQPNVQVSCGVGLTCINTVIPTINFNTVVQTLGQITLNGANQGPYAGGVTAASITGPDGGSPHTLGVGPGDTDIDNLQISNYTVTEGLQTWTLSADFAAGPMPLDSTGANYPSLQYTGGSDSAITSFVGAFPIQLGTAGGNTSWTERSLVSHDSNNITCSQAYDEVAGGVRHRIAIADAMIDSKTVGFQQWNPVASAYADLDASEFTSSAQTFNDVGGIVGNNVAYTVYTKASAPGGGDPGGTPIYRIKFS